MIVPYSSVIFYNTEKQVLIQDRRNLWRDDKEWSFFGGRAEGNETPLETAIREIEEEIHIRLQPEDLAYLGRVVRESVLEWRTTEGSVFIASWKPEYDDVFVVLEWAWSEWVTLEEMRQRKTYDAQFVMVGFAEIFFSQNA